MHRTELLYTVQCHGWVGALEGNKRIVQDDVHEIVALGKWVVTVQVYTGRYVV